MVLMDKADTTHCMGNIGTVAVRSIRPSGLEREVESAYESVWEVGGRGRLQRREDPLPG